VSSKSGEPVLRQDTRQNRKLEQDDVSKKSHLALALRHPVKANIVTLGKAQASPSCEQIE
jgi:hypothetical protein